MGQSSGMMWFQWDNHLEKNGSNGTIIINHLEKCCFNGKIIYKSDFESGNFSMKRTFSHGEGTMELT